MNEGTRAELDELGAEIITVNDRVTTYRYAAYQIGDEHYTACRGQGLNHTEAERYARIAAREQNYQTARAETELANLRFRYDHLRLLLEHGVG